MRIGYFDCFGGIAGDMLLAAAMDAGCPLDFLQGIAARLNLPGVTLSAERVKRRGVSCTHVMVHVPPAAQKKHRHLPQIFEIIDRAGLDRELASRAKSVFAHLAQAEATVHGTTPEKVHFHEVGAADAIIDIVCGCAAVRQLGVDEIVCSPIPTGVGTLTCEHGVMPVPAPATANLLRGVPLAPCDEPDEMTTPTGAALATTLAARFGPPPAMRITSIGYGAGTREGTTRPNFFRLILGEASDAPTPESDVVTVLEAEVDDATGQSLAFACERLLQAGALDAYLVPIIMKKGRPGCLITALARPEDATKLEAQILRETTTFGVRRHDAQRAKLARRHVRVATAFGEIRVKEGRAADRVIHAWPEYEDCAAAAREAGVGLDVVQRAALDAWARDARVSCES
ncbi:MAG: nickel pincer cofactor biosynthesis protein LarC [Phycisphaerae bacterium]